jgi:hypothetical protein
MIVNYSCNENGGQGSNPLQHPDVANMAQWKAREPPKTKSELREMLAEAVRNTAPPEPEPPERQRSKAKKRSSRLKVVLSQT